MNLNNLSKYVPLIQALEQNGVLDAKNSVITLEIALNGDSVPTDVFVIKPGSKQRIFKREKVLTKPIKSATISLAG